MNQPLHKQNLAHASYETKIALSLLATAMSDALGGPAEFHKRFNFDLVTKMVRNRTFGLEPGTWTDDTSMALCLARSIAQGVSRKSNGTGGFNQFDQLEAYTKWYRQGYLSAIGRCFDIGMGVRMALIYYNRQDDPQVGLQQIKKHLNDEFSAGNGSLMRVLPVGLAYWRCPPGQDTSEEGENDIWREYARRSSETTHPNTLCMEACEVWVGAIVKIMRANARRVGFTKLDLLKYFASFKYTENVLRKALALPTNETVPQALDDNIAIEEHYRKYHPILKLIIKTQNSTTGPNNPLNLPSEDDLPSTGYVLDTVVAALYCFFSTESFEEGAIAAVNLGDDADTVAAVYGGLAGCWYSTEETDEPDGLFWSDNVREWRDALVKRELVEEVASELILSDQRRSEMSNS